MNRKLLLPGLALTLGGLLGGCATSYQYREGAGDYYYGQPSVDYYDDGYGYGGYGYPGGWSGSLGFGYGYGGYGYGGYGYPWGGYGYPYGGYWNPYFPRPPIIIERRHHDDGHHDDHDEDDTRPRRPRGDGVPPDDGRRLDQPRVNGRIVRPPSPPLVPSRPRPLMSAPLPSRPLSSTFDRASGGPMPAVRMPVAPLPSRPLRPMLRTEPTLPMAPVAHPPRSVDFAPPARVIERAPMRTPERVERERDGRRNSTP